MQTSILQSSCCPRCCLISVHALSHLGGKSIFLSCSCFIHPCEAFVCCAFFSVPSSWEDVLLQRCSVSATPPHLTSPCLSPPRHQGHIPPSTSTTWLTIGDLKARCKCSCYGGNNECTADVEVRGQQSDNNGVFGIFWQGSIYYKAIDSKKER